MPPSALRNKALHRLGALGINWHYLLPRHANVRVVVIFLRRRRRRRRLDSRNHRFRGGLVPTRTRCRGGRRRGQPGGVAPGMLSGTACGLLLVLLMLLLRGILAVALQMNAFPRLVLPALGAVLLPATSLPQTKHSFYSY